MINENIFKFRRNRGEDFQIPITSDTAFKNVMKHERQYINKIMTELIGLPLSSITSAVFVDNITPVPIKNNKVMVVDLLLEVNENNFINIEANSYSCDTLIKNASYVYRLILDKQIKGEKYTIINVNQLNFDAYHFKFNKKIINVFTTREENTNEYLPNMPRFIHIALDNLEKNTYNEAISDWLFRALKLMKSTSIKLSKEIAGDDEILRSVAKYMEDFSKDGYSLIYYDEEEENRKLQNFALDNATKNGVELGKLAGIEIGIKSGAKEKTIEIAKKLIKQEVPLETIAISTELPLKKVKELFDEFKKEKDKK